MRASLQTVVMISCAIVGFPAALGAFVATAFGGRPTTVEILVWLAVIMVLCGAVVQLGRVLYGRQSTLETWHSALRTWSEQLDKADTEMREREWALTWAEGAPKMTSRRPR